MDRILCFSKLYVTIACKRFKTVMSGIQPTGVPHLGNYFGAINQWIKLKKDPNIDRIFISIVDLHSITSFDKLNNINENVYQMAASLMGCGLIGENVSLFQQSNIKNHAYLAWILMCICPLSKLQNMPQWKEKLEIWPGDELPNGGLLMYPILQAADILLYAPEVVPVGKDQIIHLELTRYLRNKLINWHYQHRPQERDNHDCELAKYLPLPNMMKCRFPKIYNLKNYQKKMSKSDENINSRIELMDSPDQIRNKIMKSQTDAFSTKITYDINERPALANLIHIYCSIKDLEPENAILEIEKLSKVQFKELLIDELVQLIDPIRLKIIDLLNNRDEIDRVLKSGHEIANQKSTETINIIAHHIGLKSHVFDSFKTAGEIRL